MAFDGTICASNNPEIECMLPSNPINTFEISIVNIPITQMAIYQFIECMNTPNEVDAYLTVGVPGNIWMTNLEATFQN